VVRVIASTATDAALAVVLGGALGVGVWMLLSLAPRWGAPTLARRIAPYIRDVSDPRGLTPVTPVAFFDPRAGLRSLQDRAGRMLGSSEAVAHRLHQAGWTMDAAAFRGRQLLCAIAGLLAGGLVAVGLVLAGRGSGILVVLPILAGFGAALAWDAYLTRAVRARRARIEDELPTVVEFLALCLSAGEGILDSLRRVSAVGSGELTGELRSVVVAVGTGSPLGESLAVLTRRLDVPALTRVIDQLIAAIERGAPLAHVLHSQALDAREAAKSTLIAQAGRKEIFMLVPLVFMILPLSVLFAVFPGIFMLRLGIG
jgi:tight adherence protein C